MSIKRKSRGKEAGFTLVETLVVMIIMGVIGLMLSTFIYTWLQAATLAQNRASLLDTAESSMNTITTDVQLSGDVDTNNRWADAYGPGGQYGWTSGSQVLILAKAATDSSNNILFSDPAKYISQKDNDIYYLSGSNLYRRTLSAGVANDAAVTTCPPANASASCPADKLIARAVTSLSFSYIDSGGNTTTPTSARSVQVSLTLTKTQNARSITASYSTRMVLRNE
ncbi:MAG TPA: type II secretion system protein [Candidatus Saccharimonadales bacterium]